MINNRNKSVVKSMAWNTDGQKICIVYEDGKHWCWNLLCLHIVYSFYDNDVFSSTAFLQVKAMAFSLKSDF